MTSFHPGDRVRFESLGDDGFPVVRYGFVGRCDGDDTEPVVVLLDEDLNGGSIVDRDALVPVSVTTVELCLDGADLLADPALRSGLVNLWAAEAECAGLEVRSLHPVGDDRAVDAPTGAGLRDSSEGYVLAELVAGGEQYVLRATCCPSEGDTANGGMVRVRADLPNRWTL